jgi:hypothetical protein
MQVETKQYDTVLNNDIREVHVHIQNELTAISQSREGDCQDKAIINLKPDAGKHRTSSLQIRYSETGLTGTGTYLQLSIPTGTQRAVVRTLANDLVMLKTFFLQFYKAVGL